MSRLKLFSSICIGFFVYIFLSITIGPNGVWAYRQLTEQKKALTENVAALQSVNDNLVLDYQSLESDSARIMALARKLGYVGPDEVLVKINGISERGNKVYDCGSVYHVSEINYLKEPACKLMGLIFFCLSSLLFLVSSFKKSKKPSASVVTATVATIVSR